MQNALIHHRPKNEFQAKFSMEYSMAILLIERRAYIPEYQDKRINKSDVQKMLRKINFYKDKILKSQLESLNVLYVSLTRAINNLFLICPKETDLNDPLKSYSTLINQFLIEENKTPEDDNSYVWGKFFKPSKRKYEEENSIEKIPIEISTNWHEKLHKKNLSKDLNPQSIKSDKGIVIHELLSRLKYDNDLTQIINFGIETNKIKIQNAKMLFTP